MFLLHNLYFSKYRLRFLTNTSQKYADTPLPDYGEGR